MNSKKIAVLIPSYNRKSYLQSTLDDLYACDMPEKWNIQVIAVVDGSTDGTLEMLRELYPETIVLTCHDYWYTKSINLGMQYIVNYDYDYVLTLNDDIKVPANYFQELKKASVLAPENSLVGTVNKSLEDDHRIISLGVKRIGTVSMKNISYQPKEILPETTIKPVKVLPGRGLLIPIRIIKEIGFFDEHFAQYQSDFDFCLRAGKAGYSSFISYRAYLNVYEKETSASTSYFKKGILTLLKLYFNKYSRIYLPSKARYIYRHGIKFLWPVSFTIFVLSSLRANLRNH